MSQESPQILPHHCCLNPMKSKAFLVDVQRTRHFLGGLPGFPRCRGTNMDQTCWSVDDLALDILVLLLKDRSLNHLTKKTRISHTIALSFDNRSNWIAQLKALLSFYISNIGSSCALGIWTIFFVGEISDLIQIPKFCSKNGHVPKLATGASSWISWIKSAVGKPPFPIGPMVIECQRHQHQSWGLHQPRNVESSQGLIHLLWSTFRHSTVGYV